MKADRRLVMLLVLAIAFMIGAIAHDAPQAELPVDIQGGFIEFDTAEIFGLPVMEAECLAEPSPLDLLPAL